MASNYCRRTLSAWLLVVLVALSGQIAWAAPSAPDSFSGRLEGTTVNLSWNAVDTANGYNIYRNNRYLTTTSSTSYQDTVVEGDTNSYYLIAFSKSPTEFSPRSEQLTLPKVPEPDDKTIPPSVPVNLAGSISGSSVTLNWEPSTDDEAVAGYNVYRNGAYLNTVFDTTYSGTVEADRTYTFSVVAFDVRVNFSQATAPLTLPENTSEDTPPSKPTALVGSIGQHDGVLSASFSWDAADDDRGIRGYNVYQNDEYLSTVTETGFRVPVDAGAAYTYYVVAFDTATQFSPRSDTLELPDAEKDIEPPTSPANLLGSWAEDSGMADITIEWDAASDNRNVAGYNVYENNQYLTTVTDTRFDKRVDASIIQTYSVVAFDGERNFSARSERITVPEFGNHAPTFAGLSDVLDYAGADVEILIRPSDVDGTVPGLFIGSLPVGMYSEDNFDGSRSLIWRPLQPQVGVHDIEVTAIDSEDPTLTTVRTFRLTIALPDDPDSIRNEPPGINLIEDHVVRIGDTVIMEVKGTDPNGTIPELSLLNPPQNSTFEQHPTDPNFKVLRWDTNTDDAGINQLNFKAIDAKDPTLIATSRVAINVSDPADFVRPGDRLKELAFARDLQIGYASLLKYYNRPDADLYKSVAREEFTLVSTENSMKWGYINPLPDVYRFDGADALVDFAAANGMDVHGHTMVWYTALPQWVQKSAIEDRQDIMNNFIDTLTSRYPAVKIWDVVNEAFEDDGSYRNSVWYQAMGKEHIELAFRRARAGAPNAKLIYNDYDIAYGDAKTDAAFQLMEELLASGAPLNGIGFQMHVDADFTNFDKVADTFQRFANLGLDIYITEMDVSIKEDQTEDQQANVFEQITTVCLQQAACKALQVWGITDRYSWLKEYTPLLLDKNYQVKPAYTAIQRALSQN